VDSNRKDQELTDNLERVGDADAAEDEAAHAADAVDDAEADADAFAEDEGEEEVDGRSSRIGRRIGFIIACCILLMIIGTVLGVGMFFANGLKPVEAKDEPVIISVKSGMSSKQIAQLLEDNGLIKSEFVFRYYLRINKEGSRFQAGDYSMKPGMELEEIVAMLNNGDTIKPPTFKFTIPEGYTIEKIADKLAEEKLINREKFLELASQPELFSSEYVGQIPDNPDISYSLEGYLFPETYEMVKGSSEQEIIARMVAELDRKLKQLPDDWQTQLEQLGISFHELLTVASLIEREAAVAEERPIIASVIYNRLKREMLLQIDATVQYALDAHKDVLLIEDTEIDSPYNTYKINGLPPGPIASPGLDSIRAALYPEDTKYLFYVTKKDGTQEHLFAETYEQHLRNKAASERQ